MKRPRSYAARRYKFRRAALPVDEQGNGIAIMAAIREYLSDILGAFIPGVYFSIHLFVSAALFLIIINCGIKRDIMDFVRQNAAFMVFLFCLFSYIIGSVFYRKDIKEPDTASAVLTYKNTAPEDRKGLAFDIEETDAVKKKPDEAKKPDGAQPRKTLRERIRDFGGRVAGVFKKKKYLVDFPYLRLKRYLNYRNYTRLAEHIPWNGDDKNSFSRRSKMFINRLKCRIHIYAPGEMQEIGKNEAHVRLMNSLWYAAKSIRNISVAAFLIVTASCAGSYLMSTGGKSAASIISLVYSFIFGKKQTPDFTYFLLLFLIVQFAVAAYIRRSIKQFFHYMRVREIVFILEIADTIGRNTGIDMFEELGQ